MNILLHRLYANNFKQLTDVEIHFPEKGTILIEGANEAGKSSLFEAIFFALYGQGLQGKIEDLRNYEAGEMQVELDFSVAGRRFTITRRYVGAHKATLNTHDGKPELRTLTPIEQRLKQELRLSAEALRNTCFVEQKRLERLEDLGTSKRLQAVNELLNLRILSTLTAEFKVTNQDEAHVKSLEKRVRVALLDTQLPLLQHARRDAWICWRFALLHDTLQQIREIQTEKEHAEREYKEIEQRLGALSRSLAECQRLRQLIQAINTDLMLRTSAWQEAECEWEKGKRHVWELTTLKATLPERDVFLTQVDAWGKQLHLLETLEQKAATFAADMASLQLTIKNFDALYQTWHATEREQEAQSRACNDRRNALAQAETTWRVRQEANQRDSKLTLLCHHVDSLTSALEQEAEREEQLRIIREAIALLPERQKHLRELDTARKLLVARNDALQKLKEIEKLQNEVQRKRADHVNRLAQIATLQTEFDALERQLQEATQAEKAAEALVRVGEIRKALTDWREAADRCAEADPVAGKRAEANQRYQEAQQKLAEKARQKDLATRQLLPGYLLSAVGGLIGIAGLAMHPLVTLGLLGLLLLGIGLVLAIRGTRAKSGAEAEYAEAKSEFDRQEGKRETVEAEAQTYAAQHQQWVGREAECRQRLLQLSISVPASPAEAQSLILQLPEIASAEAQQKLTEASQALNTHRANLEVKRHILEQERAITQAFDDTALSADTETWKQQERECRTACENAQNLAARLQQWGLKDSLDAVDRALVSLRDEISTLLARQGQIPELETQRNDYRTHAATASEKAAALARDLQISGRDALEWRQLATGEQEALRKEKALHPDAVLEATVRQEREAVHGLEKALTTLAAEQKERKKRLDARPRADMITEQEGLAHELAQNQAEQACHSTVRKTLTNWKLPEESESLRIELARLQTEMNRDRQTVETLPTVQKELAAVTIKVQTCRNALAVAWETHFSTACPDALEAVQEQLPLLRKKAEQDLDSYHESELNREKIQCESRQGVLNRTIVTCIHRQTEAEKQRKDYLKELHAEPEIEVEAMVDQYPVLRRTAEHTAEEWNVAVQEQDEAIRQNRSDRMAKADDLGIDGSPLNLEGEEEVWKQARLALTVKRRAGEMVNRTRESIVNRIMPLTMENMRRMLPLLTEGRYQDAEWDQNDNTISVYDMRARSYQQKSVFSGGARDQISLALRLAFALATLPGEHNIRPGWLFLDEPLSSFDRPRTQALVDLLTRGLIRQQFAQIFLVSHSESFDPNQFDYRIRMEAGRVAESSLPKVLPDAGHTNVPG